jgi:cytochrome bd-type quinol oxidase subunit 1
MNLVLKSIGYFLSELSIILLAYTAWAGAQGNHRLQVAVTVGSALALTGMAMRWIAYCRKQYRKRRSL